MLDQIFKSYQTQNQDSLKQSHRPYDQFPMNGVRQRINCHEIIQFMNIQCFQNIGTILKFCSDSARTEVEIEFLF